MWRGLSPADFGPCKDQTPQAEARATVEFLRIQFLGEIDANAH
jgi:hypothetical protein